MKKGRMALILCLLFCILLVSPAFAESVPPRIVDDAGLLTQNEKSTLASYAQSLSDTYSMDVVILTVESLSFQEAEAYADDYFDYHGYGIGPKHSGILLLVSIGDREWAISTCGAAISAVTDRGHRRLENAMLQDLSDGRYYAAFQNYLGELERQFQTYENGSSKAQPSLSLAKILICVGIAAAISGGTLWIMTAQMKTSKLKSQANAYVEKNSFHITSSRDIFLYSTFSRTRRQESTGGGSSVHTSSSGRSHGGSHGRF